MRMADVKPQAWGARPCPIPTRMVPDFEALFDILNAQGWLVLEPPPIDHRETAIGALESKIVKDFKNWMINNPRLMLNHRRIGEYRWYITIGAPCKSAHNRRKAQQGESK
jgi:hypothetical protein